MSEDAIDLKYAKQVADYIGSDHTEVIMTKQQVLDSLEEVISILGTYDITTVRASMGMYLLCRWIHENTDIRVLLTGEISDELFGLNTPISHLPQKSSRKRIRKNASASCICTTCSAQTAASPKLAGSARSVRRYRLRKIRDGP